MAGREHGYWDQGLPASVVMEYWIRGDDARSLSTGALEEYKQHWLVPRIDLRISDEESTPSKIDASLRAASLLSSQIFEFI